MGEATKPQDRERNAYDYVGAAQSFRDSLERAGLGAMPTQMPPPADHDRLQEARDRAVDAAIRTGRMDALRTYRKDIVDWALALYRRHGLSPVYFTGYWSSAERRVEAIEILLDAMTAYLLQDVLPEDVAVTLLTRFDVVFAGPVFQVDAEPGAMTDGTPTALLVIAGLILVKEAGVPIPVPGDLVVIGAGVAANQGSLDPLVALVAIVLASIVGGIAQYGLLRSVARPLLLRLLGRLGSAERIERQTERLRRGGARSVAIARSTPGVRIVAIAASALAGVPAVAFVAGLAIGNAFFIAAHFGLGYVIGPPVVAAVGGVLGTLAIGIAGLAVIGAAGWVALTPWRRRRPAPAIAAIAGWADACCPACLVLGAMASRASTQPEAGA